MMRGQDYLYFLNDSRARVAVISEPLLAEAGPVALPGALPQARRRGRQARRRPDRLRRVARQGLVHARGRRHVQGRRLLLALLLGLDRLSEGRRPPPARHGGLLGHLRAPGAGHHARGQDLLGGQALLRLRPRQQHVLPACAWARRACSTRTGRCPRRCSRSISRHRPTIFFGVPTLYAAMLQVKEAEKRYDLSSRAPLRVGRRGAAGGDLQALARALRRRDPRRHRHDRDPAHLPLEPAGAGAAGLDGPRGAGLRGAHRGRRGAAGAAGRDRQPARQGRLDHGVLLEPAREDQGDALRRVDPHRRQVLPGRGRLLLVLRPRATTC